MPSRSPFQGIKADASAISSCLSKEAWLSALAGDGKMQQSKARCRRKRFIPFSPTAIAGVYAQPLIEVNDHRGARTGGLIDGRTRYTVKCCLTISALNSSLLPAATTAPLAITTYFSANRAAKW